MPLSPFCIQANCKVSWLYYTYVFGEGLGNRHFFSDTSMFSSLPAQDTDDIPDYTLAKSGSQAVLPCRVPQGIGETKAVMWTREDMEDSYVLFSKDGEMEYGAQHPSFMDRAQFQNELTTGNLSMILKNVTPDDNGVYHCNYYTTVNRWETVPVTLYVTSPPPFIGSGGQASAFSMAVCIGVFMGILIILLIVWLLFIQVKRDTEASYTLEHWYSPGDPVDSFVQYH